MLRLHDLPNAMVLQKHQAQYYWEERGSRWIIQDVPFRRLLDTIAPSDWMCHWHSRFYLHRVGEKEFVREAPIIVFQHLTQLVQVKLSL